MWVLDVALGLGQALGQHLRLPDPGMNDPTRKPPHLANEVVAEADQEKEER